MVCKFFEKKPVSLGQTETLAARDKPAFDSGIKNENIKKQNLLKELRKPIIHLKNGK